MCPRHHLLFCACNAVWLAPELHVSMGSSPSLWFLHAKQRLLDQITSLLGYQTSPVVLCMQNSVICTRMTSLYGFQPSSVFFFMQNSEFMTRLTSLYGVQTSSVVFACKPATFGPKLHVSMGPRTHLWFSSCKTPCLASELLVSMGPSPHLWFLHSKQRPLEPNNKSLWVPDITCRFVQAIQRD